MKIVHAVHNYFPILGGMERAVQFLAEEQAKLGHKVRVVTSPYGAGGRPREEVINSVYVHRIKALRLHFPDLTVPREIPRELLREADIVHVHSQNSLFSIKVLEETSMFGAKTACHFMAVDALKNHPNPLIRLLGSYYSSRNTQKAIKLSNLILTKSPRDKEILENKYAVNKSYHLPDALPDYYFMVQRESLEEFPEKFGIKQEKFFLFIGRIHRLKGPHILVQALKYLDKEVAVVFIGPDGGYARETLNLAARIGVDGKVYTLGYVDEETKIRALDSAVALILPSITDYVEVYPMVISEAWAREKPVIASDVGGVPYRIRERMNGILVKPSNPESLAEAMLELLRDDKLVREMGENGRGEVLLWREVAVRSVELYKLVFDYQKNER